MGETLDTDESTRSIPVAVTSSSVEESVQPQLSTIPREGTVDWRKLDPSTIRESGILVEELLTYRENLDDLLQRGSGQFVLIVGREIISLFPNLESAARYAAEHFRGRDLLIKKISQFEPIHTLGGAVLETRHATASVID
jgi:hypothetical protein